MTQETSNLLCPHPEDRVQSGVYARGVYLPPVCLECGQHLLSETTMEVLEDIEHEEDIHD